MSTTITLPERNTLRSSAFKYLIEKIGYNIRPAEPFFDEEKNLWYVNCNAIISNYISNIGTEGKHFVYTFENVSELIYEQIDSNLVLIEKPKKSDIEKIIYDRYIRLTSEIEKELLIAGSNSWGKLTLVKYFLSPLYSMISNLIDKGYLSIQDINKGQNYKFFKLLLGAGYINVDSDDENIFIKNNKLTNLCEHLYKNNRDITIFNITENVVGIIFGNYYDMIKYDFGIRPPSSYVDYAKAYYFDALRYGGLIRVNERDILNSLYNFNIFVNDKMNFRKSLIELSNTDILNKTEENYYGDETIFSQMFVYRDSLIEGAKEI